MNILLNLIVWPIVLMFLFGAIFLTELPATIIIYNGLAYISSVFICSIVRWLDKDLKIYINSALFILTVAYPIQQIIYIYSNNDENSLVAQIISYKNIFSEMHAIGADNYQIIIASKLIAVSFIALLFSTMALYKTSYKVPRGAYFYMHRNGIKLLISTSFFTTLVFGLLRKYFGLDSYSTIQILPFGLGGVINFSSAYLGPFCSLAAFYFSTKSNEEDIKNRSAFNMLVVAAFNFMLFTSKLSVIIPIAYIVFNKILNNQLKIKNINIVIFFVVVATIYPLFNIYRAADALNINFYDYARQFLSEAAGGFSSDFQIYTYGISSIIGRFTGYDPLIILIQQNPLPYGLLEYFLNYNLDQYLTYEVMGYVDAMGYSPGLIGRQYYISGSILFTATSIFLFVTFCGFILSNTMRVVGVRLWLQPLLLSLLIIFFIDGIRWELVRSMAICMMATHIFVIVICNIVNKK